MEAKGLELAKLGLYVFPCNQYKKPFKNSSGHLEATTDPEQIKAWVKEHKGENILWGVHAGRSGLVVGDADRKTGRDGFVSLDNDWKELPPTFHYETQTGGGEHHLYIAPKNKVLPPAVDYRGYVGFDRRSGSSYFIFWSDELPTSREEFAEAPSWLLDEGVTRTGASFEGGLDDWLENLEVGSPTPKIKDIIADFPKEDFGHSEMVERQMELIRLGAERHSGVWDALDKLRTLWIQRDPALHSTPQMDWPWKFDEALYSGISKYGATSELLANLPPYRESVDMLPEDFDTEEYIFGEEQSQKFYFKLIEKLVLTDLSDERIISILWNSPTVSRWAVEWGEQYLVDMLKEKRATAPKKADPSSIAVSKTQVDEPERISLLTDDERKYLLGTHTIVDLYLDWVQTRLPRVNEPYHTMQALTIASCAYAPYGYLAAESTLNLNLYQISLGESSTGKTQSEEYRDKLLRVVMADDKAYLTGDNPSPNGLHKMLLQRDGKWTLFSSSEVAGFLSTAGSSSPGNQSGWMTGMLTQLTKYYDGYIPPMVRVDSTAEEDAHGYLSISALGTPDKVFELLTKDLFTDGFLARFLWSFGTAQTGPQEPVISVQQKMGVDFKELDPEGIQGADAFTGFLNGKRDMIYRDEEITARESDLLNRLRWLANKSDLSELLTPSFTRLGDNVRKIAAIFAMSEGFTKVKKRHLLQAIKLGEVFANNAVKAAQEVTETRLQKDLDLVYNWILTQGQYVKQTTLAKKFAGRFGRDYRLITSTLEAQGLIGDRVISGAESYQVL